MWQQTPPDLPTSHKPTSLSPQSLHDEFKSYITNYNAHLGKLLPLLEASFHPTHQPHLLEDIQSTLKEIATERDPYSAIQKDKQVDKEPVPVFTPSKQVFEADGSGVLACVQPTVFNNWGLTVEHEVSAMFEPHSVVGVQNVVKWAKERGKRVRCAGFRHTWTNLFGDDGGVILLLQPLSSLIKLPYISPPKSWVSQLQGVEILPSVAGRPPKPNHAFAKIMAGTTNDYFRQWCFTNKTVCIPFNVIMVEVTFGGTNAPICHGAGLSSSTLSDLVVQVDYVDANGELQSIIDPDELRAASGCFGLLGVVVSLTLQLDEMARAELAPVKQHFALAVPPPKGYQLPKQVEEEIQETGFTEKDFETARKEFVKRCEEDYYVEWFWFPYQRYVWTNTWKKYEITDDESLQAYPGNGLLDGVEAQWAQGALAECIVHWWAWKNLGGYQQAFLFGLATLATLPNITDPKDKISTYVSEALHFRRGVQNLRVWDTEWEIPIPAQSNGNRDYNTIQRAWWDGISAIYSRPDAPVRVALEMRLTGSSNVLLAPQRGNNLGTVSIEALTTLTTPEKDWKSFCQQVADLWTSYTDEEGRLLNARPHWAKQWEGLRVHGKPIEEYLKETAFADAFAEFRKTIGVITQRRGSNMKETEERFGNKFLDKLYIRKRKRQLLSVNTWLARFDKLLFNRNLKF